VSALLAFLKISMRTYSNLVLVIVFIAWLASWNLLSAFIFFRVSEYEVPSVLIIIESGLPRGLLLPVSVLQVMIPLN
jgi:hypothetical protein